LFAELAALRTRLAALLTQANRPTASSSTTHIVFIRDLSLGMTGNDVRSLQQFLIQENAGPAARALKAHGTTRTFGALTQAALIEFQKKVGITPTSGYFGPKTRAYVNSVNQ
jgi:peptidoglycan hydrolase-like protein with peptidoglycan-binding domain